MRNFSTVFSAWHEDELVGLVCEMVDGIMNAYIHYVLVKPKYQLKGVGKELLERVKSHYKDYLKIVVITEESISSTCVGVRRIEDSFPTSPACLSTRTLSKRFEFSILRTPLSTDITRYSRNTMRGFAS